MAITCTCLIPAGTDIAALYPGAESHILAEASEYADQYIRVARVEVGKVQAVVLMEGCVEKDGVMVNAYNLPEVAFAHGDADGSARIKVQAYEALKALSMFSSVVDC